MNLSETENYILNCLDNGYVRLVSYGPISPSDLKESEESKQLKEGAEGTKETDESVSILEKTILKAARTSYANDTKKTTKKEDLSLLEYLISMRHTSPFEMVEFCFEIKLPLSIAVHFLRHRTANVNMVSFRYTQPENEDFYKPNFRLQDKNRRQCSSQQSLPEDKKTEVEKIQSEMDECISKLFFNYDRLINEFGVAREVARFYLPNSTYTRMYWKLDLHNLLHFLSLRMAEDAQYETRVYAEAISTLITPHIPNILEIYNRHRLQSITFSSEEFEIFKNVLNGQDLDEQLKDMSARKRNLIQTKIGHFFDKK